MGNLNSCIAKAQELFTYLNQNENEWMNGVVLPEGSFCFKVPIPKHKGVRISISVPPDAMGNRGNIINSSTSQPYDEGDPSTFETAIDVDGRIISDLEYFGKEIGYYDVCRFESFIEIKEEIEKIISFFEENENKDDIIEELQKIRNSKTSDSDSE